ncbi:MAG: hypothetical protein PG981_000653 [Wolbachia endosymbiont of Ctenocephalides orientis wCori]|nr:MAG: hypothetical protein PG981_000653 [Wolbachia endosymbiont of Ctenocephalides orientis wCori]
MDLSGTTKYLKNRVMHSTIDLTLSYLMNCYNITLDEERKKDLNKLVESVQGKVKDASDNGIVSFLKKKGLVRNSLEMNFYHR